MEDFKTMTIEDRVERLENKLDLLIKNLELRIANNDKPDDLIHIGDIKKLYKNLDFSAFYEKCKEYQRFVDSGTDESESKWADDCVDGESMFSRIFLCLAWFDIDKTAEQIVTLNENLREKITYTDVIDTLSFSEWRTALLNSLKELIRDFVVYGEATEDDTYKVYQRGRITLESIYMKFEGRGAIKMKLYFSDNNCEAYPDSWD